MPYFHHQRENVKFNRNYEGNKLSPPFTKNGKVVVKVPMTVREDYKND